MIVGHSTIAAMRVSHREREDSVHLNALTTRRHRAAAAKLPMSGPEIEHRPRVRKKLAKEQHGQHSA